VIESTSDAGTCRIEDIEDRVARSYERMAPTLFDFCVSNIRALRKSP